LHVADARQKRRRNEAYLKRLQTLNDAPVMEQATPEDSPLARRIADIRMRSAERSDDN